MKNIFKKGLIFGGLLTVVTALGFAMSRSKKGKKLTLTLQQDLKAVAKNLKASLSKLNEVNKEKFDEVATAVVDEYAKEKEMARKAKQALLTELQYKWYEIKDGYLLRKNDKRIEQLLDILD